MSTHAEKTSFLMEDDDSDSSTEDILNILEDIATANSDLEFEADDLSSKCSQLNLNDFETSEPDEEGEPAEEEKPPKKERTGPPPASKSINKNRSESKKKKQGPRSERSATKHETSASNYRCNICNISYVHLSGLTNHNTKKHSSNKIVCRECDRQVTSQMRLLKHQADHFKARLACTQCGDKFWHQALLNEHTAHHESGTFKPVKCKVCKDRFQCKASLVYHEMTIHGSGPLKKPFSCLSCKESFLTLTILRKHSRIHPKTSKVLEYEYALEEKMALDSRLPYRCHVCEKKYGEMKHLRAHMMRHEKKMGKLLNKTAKFNRNPTYKKAKKQLTK